MKHEVKMQQRGTNGALVKITFFPENEKEQQLINGAKNAELSAKDHTYFNDLLTSILLSNNFTPIMAAGELGNSFFFRVM